jgi:predicted nucleic acid-binding protein
LVDTSVLINYLKGATDKKTLLLDDILARDLAFGISPYTYQEVLQGAKTEKEFHTLKKYLNTQNIYYLPQNLSLAETGARMYYTLRRAGFTLRGTIDVLIALTALHFDLALLHDDHDFDRMSQYFPQLKILHFV